MKFLYPFLIVIISYINSLAVDSLEFVIVNQYDLQEQSIIIVDVEQDIGGNFYVLGKYSGAASIGGTDLPVASNFTMMVAKFNNSGIMQWVANTAINNDISVTPELISLDSSGSVIVAGQFFVWTSNSSLEFGNSVTLPISNFQDDVFLIKYDFDGIAQWAKKFNFGDGPGFEIARILKTDINNNYYLGAEGLKTNTTPDELTYHISSFKTDGTSRGELKWSDSYDSSSEIPAIPVLLDFAIDNSSDIIITGDFFTTVYFNDFISITPNGGNDLFLAKFQVINDLLDKDNLIWVNKYGGNNTNNGNQFTDTGKCLSVDLQNNIYLTGKFMHTINFGSNSLTATTNSASNFEWEDAFLAKFDFNGVSLWAERGGGGWSDEGWFVKFDILNDLYTNFYFNADDSPNEELTVGDSILPNGVNTPSAYITKFDETNGTLSTYLGDDVIGFSKNSQLNPTASGVNYWKIITGNITIDSITYSPSNGSLLIIKIKSIIHTPIELISFKIEIEEKENITLIWQTASEINFKEFEIERSSDGLNFNKIATVQSQNRDGLSHYKYVDEDILLNSTVYYRLKIIDHDESFEYSEIRGIEVKGKLPEIQIYPNPIKSDVLNIKCHNCSPISSIRIINTLGEKVSSNIVNSDRSSFSVELPKFINPGIYFIQFLIEGQTITKKFLI